MDGLQLSQVRPWLRRLDQKRMALLLAAVVILVDQLSKLWVRQALPLYSSFPSEGPLRINHVINPGLLLGLEVPFVVGLVLPIGTVLVAFFLYWRYFPSDNRLSGVAMGLFLGGCLGNVVDRITVGGVTDIIDVAISPSIGRLIFNLADFACIAGMILFDVYLIRLRRLHIPKQQYLVSYLWKGFVAVERSRAQAGQWWKPAFLRPEGQKPAMETSPGPQ